MVLEALIEDGAATPLLALRKADLASWLEQQPETLQHWVRASDFVADAHSILRLPADHGYLVGLGDGADRWSFASLPSALPVGAYRLDASAKKELATQAALGWALGSYRFGRYKAAKRGFAQLVWPSKADRRAVTRDARAVALIRDLINTPASDLGPQELQESAERIAREFGATCSVTIGEALVREGYELVYAVGRGSPRQPRLIDLTWGDPNTPKVTLVGKGVCFDTGGLNIKQWAGMLVMKADMGGAAHALALAQMIMEAKLPVRLRMLIPAVENSVSGDATRPLDVVRARNGLTVEIANTDAEGRLILADALVEGSSEQPDVLIDFATLTSAARVALGPDVQALFSNDDGLAHDLEASARASGDPVWRLPLWHPYAKDIEGKIADLTNVADLNLGYTTMAGAIYASLFLEKFVADGVKWAHLDIMGWNFKNRPGRPEGGDACGLYAAFHFLANRYGA